MSTITTQTTTHTRRKPIHQVWQQKMTRRATSLYVRSCNKIKKPAQMSIEQYVDRNVSFEDMMAHAQTGDLIMNGGRFPLSDFLRAQYGAKTLHSAIVWRDPENDELYAITSYTWDNLPAKRQVGNGLMRCRVCGVKHPGVQIHPLRAYLDGALTLSGEWLIWRMLTREADKTDEVYDEKSEDFDDLRTRLASVGTRSMTPHESDTLSNDLLNWTTNMCGLPYPTPGEMYRRQDAVRALNKTKKMRHLPKVGRSDAMHCSELVTRALTAVGIVRPFLPGLKHEFPAHAVINAQFEDGGLIDRGWAQPEWCYSYEVWVRPPVDSMFETSGAIKSVESLSTTLQDGCKTPGTIKSVKSLSSTLQDEKKTPIILCKEVFD